MTPTARTDIARLVEIITAEVMATLRRTAAPRAVRLPRRAATTAVRLGSAGCSTPARRASACTRPAAGPATSPG